MSLNNESGSSMSFEELVNLNGEAMAVLDEVPYQPVVYAVPKEWLERGKQMLELAVACQPTLYRQLTTLATQEEQQKLQVQLKADLEVAKREMLSELTALKKQDGSLKESFFSELSGKHTAALREIRSEYDRQQKERLRLMLVTVASSAALSGLVSGLLLLLGG